MPLRLRIWKMSFASLAFSPTPLIRAGDEMLSYPDGANNNPYDHGDHLNGVRWGSPHGFLEYAQAVMALRKRFPSLGRMLFTPPAGVNGVYGCYDVFGVQAKDSWWARSESRQITLYLPAMPDELATPDSTAELLLMFNSWREDVPMTLPKAAHSQGKKWVLRLHTCAEYPFSEETITSLDFHLGARSMALLTSVFN